MNKQKVLFIAHEASRTGAPVVLLSLLKWLKKNTDLSFEILVLIDGPLRQEFESVAKTYYIPPVYSFSIINKIRRRLYPEKTDDYKLAEIVNKLSGNKYNIIYGNTIVTLPWLLRFKKVINTKVVCAIHEMSFIIKLFLKKEYVFKELGNVDLIIAGSHAVKKNLVEEFLIPELLIKVVHSFIDTDTIIFKDSNVLRKELGIKDELIIGAMGSVFDLRKGIDMVVPLANLIKQKYPSINFKLIWVGGLKSDRMIRLMEQDVNKCGLQDDVMFIENTEYPDDYLNLFDVFVLLSREDPFPLVLLSAAYLEKAIIAFDKSGGAPEFLNNQTGFLAPYLNIDKVSDIISSLDANRTLIKKTGTKAKEKVLKDFSSDVIPARVYNILNEL